LLDMGANATSPLRAFRHAHGLTLRRLAELAGVAPSQVSRAERLQAALPRKVLRWLRTTGHDAGAIELLHERAAAARTELGDGED
jgi:transcriptional regulator with XRE-family HTH domain